MTIINPSMNTLIPADRSVNDVGFNGLFHVTTVPATEYMPTVPYNSPSHLDNHVVESQDSVKIEVGPTAGDITARTRMGGQ